MDAQSLRLIRRMAALLPISDPIKKEKAFINKNVIWSPLTTFISSRPVLKEIVFYYFLHFNQVDFVKTFTAEEVKDIYMNKHPEYTSIHDVHSPYIVVFLGGEVYNRIMIDILNLFYTAVSSGDTFKGFVYAYCGDEKDFSKTYCNPQERGLLNIGNRVVIGKSTKVTKKTQDSTVEKEVEVKDF